MQAHARYPCACGYADWFRFRLVASWPSADVVMSPDTGDSDAEVVHFTLFLGRLGTWYELGKDSSAAHSLIARDGGLLFDHTVPQARRISKTEPGVNTIWLPAA